MSCPSCKSPLVAEEGCRSCSECGGVWFTSTEALAYFGFSAEEAPAESAGQPFALAPTPSERFCPTCLTLLEHVEVGDDLALDQCARCGGLFFDAGESLALRSLLAAGHDGPTLRRRLLEIVGRVGAGPYR